MIQVIPFGIRHIKLRGFKMYPALLHCLEVILGFPVASMLLVIKDSREGMYLGPVELIYVPGAHTKRRNGFQDFTG